jgi:hypothetical protein
MRIPPIDPGDDPPLIVMTLVLSYVLEVECCAINGVNEAAKPRPANAIANPVFIAVSRAGDYVNSNTAAGLVEF